MAASSGLALSLTDHRDARIIVELMPMLRGRELIDFCQGEVMIDYRRAISLIRSTVNPVETERVGLLESIGRVVSEEIEAPTELPESPIAQIGGYAIGKTSPPAEIVRRALGEALFPGEPLPEGTDAIVSDVPPEDLADAISDLARWGGDGIIEKGQILRPAETVVHRGCVIGPSEIGFLSDLGIRRVGVYKRPHLSVLTIGDDLLKIDDIKKPYMRYDWAGALLCSSIAQCGGEFTQLGPVSENPEDIEFGVSKGLEEDGLVISTRFGWDRGEALIHILEKQGIDVVFNRVSMYPGGDALLGHIKDRPVLVLPLAVGELLVSTELLLVPFLLRVSGRIRSIRRGVSAILDADLTSPVENGRCAVWGVSIEGEREPYHALPIPQWPGGARYRSSLIYGLCVSEDGSDRQAGDTIEVLPLLTRIL